MALFAGPAKSFALAGAFASYLKEIVFEAVFPARSVHAPGTCALTPSGPLYVALSQDAMPDVVSLPWKVKVTGPVYQSPWSGARSAPAPLTLGRAESYEIGSAAFVSLPALSLQAPVTLLSAPSGPP